MIRVLVVDDSITVRKAVADRLSAAGLQVVGEAADGCEGVEMTRRLRPDVVLMDVVMPGTDGLAATRRIMNEAPTPVVILSGHVTQQEVFKTYDALAAGALEVCAKPVGGGPDEQSDWDRVLMTVAAAAQVRVMRRKSEAAAPHTSSKTRNRVRVAAAGPPRSLVVMGASTGGPGALRHILVNLPADFPIPILLALHCSSRLASSVAGWFDRESALHVTDARNGGRIPEEPGVVLTAPPGTHLKLRRGCTILIDASNDSGCSPSVDELFKSAAEEYGDRTVGVLLTGMGSDGAEGLKCIRDAGGCTIAQDEDTCTVFGMPSAAIELGAVEHVAPLQRIPDLLIRHACSSLTTSDSTRG